MSTITGANVKALNVTITEIFILSLLKSECECRAVASLHLFNCVLPSRRRAMFGYGLVCHAAVHLLEYLLIPLLLQMLALQKLRTNTKLLELSDDSTTGRSLKFNFKTPKLGRELSKFLLPFFSLIMTLE